MTLRTAWSVALVAAFLTGCSHQTPAPDPAATTTATPDVEEPGPNNPALDDAVAQWTPIDEFFIERYTEPVGDFTRDDLALMSDEIINYARMSTIDESVILADSIKDTRDLITPWLPEGTGKLTEFSTLEDGSRDSAWLYRASRLPKGSTLLDTSVYTSSWHADTFTYTDGTPGVQLTLMWRVLYRFTDPDGVIRAVPLLRWYSVHTDDPHWASQSGYWGHGFSAYATDNEPCAALFDGALTSDQHPSDIDPTAWVFFTLPPDDFMSLEDYSKDHPAATDTEKTATKNTCKGESA